MRASHAGPVAALVLIASVVIPTSGKAEENLRARGDRLCRTDARRLCADILSLGDQAVLACFQEKQAQLSGPCRKFLVEAGQL